MPAAAFLLALLAVGADAPTAAEPATVVVVVGTSGTPEYAAEFRAAADHWAEAAKQGGVRLVRIGDGSDGPADSIPDRDQLRTALANDAGKGPLWLVLIGHGTSDGREARFNLRGPDVSDAELVEWLKPTAGRPVVVVNGASASGPFLPKLSAPGRVVVTATRSGDEQNFARFGQFFAAAIADPATDLDKDGQVSVLEAFLRASGQAQEFYRGKSRLATEHALLDDNGDKLGTPADWFKGVRATRKARDGAELDGLRAHQRTLVPSERDRKLSPEARARRDQIELDLAALRTRKPTLAEDAYFGQLETLMLELARIYDQADPTPSPTPAPPGGSPR